MCYVMFDIVVQMICNVKWVMNARAHGGQLVRICWVAAGIAPIVCLFVCRSGNRTHCLFVCRSRNRAPANVVCYDLAPIVCLFHLFSFVGNLSSCYPLFGLLLLLLKLIQLLPVKKRDFFFIVRSSVTLT